MNDKRDGNDRRSVGDRRKGATSTYNGPERRSIKYRRSDDDRREKEK